jgi:hypothetical protein
MKILKFFLPLFVLLMTFASCTTAQTPPTKGEKVWIIVNYIRETAKSDYEKWMTDVFFAPMKTTQDPILKKQYDATRWLTPAKQNKDKTWTYVFIMDPVIPNGDYDIESHLVKTYGEQMGKAYMKQFEGFMAAAGQVHNLNRE